MDDKRDWNSSLSYLKEPLQQIHEMCISTETLNFEIKLTVPHRDSVDFATSHAVQRALRSLGEEVDVGNQ